MIAHNKSWVLVGIVALVAIAGTVGFFARQPQKNAEKGSGALSGVSADFVSEIDEAFREEFEVTNREDEQKTVVSSDQAVLNEFMYIFEENEKTAQ